MLQKITFLISLFIVITSTVVPVSASKYHTNIQIRVSLESIQKRNSLIHYIRENGIEKVGEAPQHNQMEFVLSPAELDEFIKQGFDYSIVKIGAPLKSRIREETGIFQVQNPGVPPPENYRNLQEIDSLMEDIANRFPEIAKVVDVTETYGGPKTIEGRTIKALKISDNVDVSENEPSMLVVSAHHSREIVTPVIALHAMEQLATGYANNSEIKNVIDSHEIWIAPVWNPDGYNFVFTSDDLWRKNRHVFSQGIGVDLNRNYPIEYDESCGGNTDVNDETYRGESASSEAETKTMLKFTERERFIKVIDFHSYGEEVVWGYGCSDHPFGSWLESEGNIISNNAGYSTVRRPAASGEHYQWQLSRGALAYLIETETEFGPPYARAVEEAEMLWPAILGVLQRPVALFGKVTDTAGAPLSAELEVPDVNYSLGERFFSDTLTGAYSLMLPGGEYNLSFSADSFFTLDTLVTIENTSGLELNIELIREIVASVPSQSSGKSPVSLFSQALNPNTSSILVFHLNGQRVNQIDIKNNDRDPQIDKSILGALPMGVYLFQTNLGESGRFFIP